jgi:DNA-binding MarR family transcriptional regulator
VSMADYYASPGYMVRRCYQIVQGIFGDAVADAPVAPTQLGVLKAIVEFPSRDQASIARAIGIDRSTMGTNVDRLEELGYLTRSAAPHDKRVKLLAITPAGIDAIDTIKERISAVGERFLAPLNAEERTTFAALMQRIIEANNDFGRAHQRSLDDFAA